MLKSNPSGFQMTFANGWTVSVQFGAFNYCNNRVTMPHRDIDRLRHKHKLNPKESNDAEIAAWDTNGNWHLFEGDNESDNEKGWCSSNEVARFISMIAAK